MRLLAVFILCISVSCEGQNFINPTWKAIDNSMNTNEAQQQQWVVFGNSLGKGNSEGSETSAAMTYSNIVYEWDNIGADVQTVSGDLYNAVSGSPWVNFAMQYYYRTGYKIVWNNCAVSGSTVGANTTSAGNDWTNTGNNWTSTNVFSPVSLCNLALGVQKPRGIIIEIGINDSGQANTITDVQTAYSDFVTRIQSKYPQVPIYFLNIGRNASGVTARVTSIRGYIDALPGLFNNVFVIAKPGDAPFADWMYQSDNIHWTQFMNEAVGAAAVNGLATQGLIRNAPQTALFGTNTNNVIGRFSSLPTDYQYAVHDWVQYCTDQSIFANFDSFYVGLMNTSANSLQDWIRGTKQATLTGSAAWTQGQGIRTGGTTSDWIDMNFNDGSDYVQGSLNDNFWLNMPMRVYTTGGSTVNTLGGGQNATSSNRIAMDQNTTGIRAWNYTATTFGPNAQFYTGRNQYFVQRTASNASSWSVNTTVLGSNASVGIAVTGVAELAGVYNNNGSKINPLDYDFGLRLRGKNSIVSNFYRKNRALLATLMVAHL